jgi:hypothetical protein
LFFIVAERSKSDEGRVEVRVADVDLGNESRAVARRSFGPLTALWGYLPPISPDFRRSAAQLSDMND